MKLVNYLFPNAKLLLANEEITKIMMDSKLSCFPNTEPHL